MKRAAAGLAGAGVFHSNSSEASAARKDRPNVLWVAIDTSRAFNHSCYGYHRKTSPNVDLLAERGVVFERAYSQYYWTAPSVSSYMTSRFFPEPIVGYAGYSDVAFIGPVPNEVLAPSEFRRAGYDTFMISSNYGFVSKDTRLGRAFDVARNTKPEKYVWGNRPEEFRYKRSFRRMNEEVFAWLDQQQQSGKPFFMYLHPIETHEPYAVPLQSPFDEWLDRGYLGPFRNFGINGINQDTVTQPDIDQLVGMYDGCIRLADHYFGQLLDHLSSIGLLDSTIVIYSSDHGESLFEDGKTVGHHFTRGGAEETRHVPLVISAPDLPNGKRISEPVGLVDIAPTLYDLCDIYPQGLIEGTSLRPVSTSSGSIDSDHLAITSEGTITGSSLKRLVLTSGDYTYEWQAVDGTGVLRPSPSWLKDWETDVITETSVAEDIDRHLRDNALPLIERALNARVAKINVFYPGHRTLWQSSDKVLVFQPGKEKRRDYPQNEWLAVSEGDEIPDLRFLATIDSQKIPEVNVDFWRFSFSGEHDVFVEISIDALENAKERPKPNLSFQVRNCSIMNVELPLTKKGEDQRWTLLGVGRHDLSKSKNALRMTLGLSSPCSFRLRRLLVVSSHLGLTEEDCLKALESDSGDAAEFQQRQEALEALGYLQE